MFDHISIGVRNVAAAQRFYDAVFAALGSESKFDSGGWLGYGVIGPGKSFMDCHTAVCAGSAEGLLRRLPA